MAEKRQIQIHTHVIAGDPIGDMIELAAELKVELLVIVPEAIPLSMKGLSAAEPTSW
jgi:hypothetical protein